MTLGSGRPPVRVAIIGLGRAAMADHYPFYRDHRNLFDVVAVCDVLKDRRDAVLKDFPGCRLYRLYADLLAERDIDMVDIAVGSSLHREIAVESLARGYWTLVESPLVLNDADAQILRGAAVRAKNRLLPVYRMPFSPDYLLAQKMVGDPRLGDVYQIVVRSEDFVRRDDWQSVKRTGGGATYYAMPDLVLATLRLMSVPPVQMLSDLKRLVSVGDVEDYAHIVFKTRTRLSADIEFNGGAIPGIRQPSFTIRGSNGVFSVQPGASEGVLRMIDPDCKLPRRRSAVSTPPFADMHEDVRTVDIPISLGPDVQSGMSVMWRKVYDSVRKAPQYPIPMDEAFAALKYSHLMRKTSPFG